MESALREVDLRLYPLTPGGRAPVDWFNEREDPDGDIHRAQTEMIGRPTGQRVGALLIADRCGEGSVIPVKGVAVAADLTQMTGAGRQRQGAVEPIEDLPGLVVSTARAQLDRTLPLRAPVQGPATRAMAAIASDRSKTKRPRDGAAPDQPGPPSRMRGSGRTSGSDSIAST